MDIIRELNFLILENFANFFILCTSCLFFLRRRATASGYGTCSNNLIGKICDRFVLRSLFGGKYIFILEATYVQRT